MNAFYSLVLVFPVVLRCYIFLVLLQLRVVTFHAVFCVLYSFVEFYTTRNIGLKKI